MTEDIIIWPEIFDKNSIEGVDDIKLCTDGLVAWAHCWAGHKPHHNFGQVMVMIGIKLGISPTGENLFHMTKEWLDKRIEEKDEKDEKRNNANISNDTRDIDFQNIEKCDV